VASDLSSGESVDLRDFAVAPEAEIDRRGFDAAVARTVKRLEQLELD
jgi:hypothetical protein